MFSSGGSSGVRGVYVWDWQLFVSLACLAWRMQARARSGAERAGARLVVLEAGEPPHASTPLFDVPIAGARATALVGAGDPFEEVVAAVARAEPTEIVGYASIVGRLARTTLATASLTFARCGSAPTPSR